MIEAAKKMGPEQVKAVEEDWLADVEEMFDSTGRHEGHVLSQVGRCVYCSCGKRVQGTLPKAAR
jgi:hypothetical protein